LFNQNNVILKFFLENNKLLYGKTYSYNIIKVDDICLIKITLLNMSYKLGYVFNSNIIKQTWYNNIKVYIYIYNNVFFRKEGGTPIIPSALSLIY